jgi:hypothetical protein
MKDLREIWKQSKENASSILLYGALLLILGFNE